MRKILTGIILILISTTASAYEQRCVQGKMSVPLPYVDGYEGIAKFDFKLLLPTRGLKGRFVTVMTNGEAPYRRITPSGKQNNTVADAISADDLEMNFVETGLRCPCIRTKAQDGSVIIDYRVDDFSKSPISFPKYFNIPSSEFDIKVTEVSECSSN